MACGVWRIVRGMCRVVCVVGCLVCAVCSVQWRVLYCLWPVCVCGVWPVCVCGVWPVVCDV